MEFLRELQEQDQQFLQDQLHDLTACNIEEKVAAAVESTITSPEAAGLIADVVRSVLLEHQTMRRMVQEAVREVEKLPSVLRSGEFSSSVGEADVAALRGSDAGAGSSAPLRLTSPAGGAAASVSVGPSSAAHGAASSSSSTRVGAGQDVAGAADCEIRQAGGGTHSCSHRRRPRE